jgi:hypothetical protein
MKILELLVDDPVEIDPSIICCILSSLGISATTECLQNARGVPKGARRQLIL